MALVSDIVYASLRKIGIRDTSNTTRMTEALLAFNDMLKSWAEIFHYYTTTEGLTVTSGTVSYTIGSGATWNTARPMKVFPSYMRYTGTTDYPIGIITREEYNNITDKSDTGYPENIFYDATNPNGTIYFDLVPSESGTFYLTSFKPFSTYAALTDTLLEPVEIEQALKYNFAVDIAPEYNIQPLQTVLDMAQLLKYDIGVRNSSPVSESGFDNALLR